MTYRHPYHPYGVYPTSGEQIVDRYIATAYENVKRVADNIDVFIQAEQILNQILASEQNVIAIGDEVRKLNLETEVLEGEIQSLTDAIGTLLSDIRSVEPAINRVLSLKLALLTVVDNQADIEAVANAISEINSVFVNIDDVITVANNVTNITSVVGVIPEIIQLTNAISDINTVVAMQPDIDTILANLTDVQAAANLATLSFTSLSLTLGAAEVPGSVYTNLYDAMEYAKSVMQVGGLLTITAPDGSFNSGSNQIILDPRMRVVITGATNTVFLGSRPILIDNGNLTVTDVDFQWTTGSGTSPVFDVSNRGFLEATDCNISEDGFLGSCIRQSGNTTVILERCNLTAEGGSMSLLKSDFASVQGCSFTSTVTATFPPPPVVLIYVAGVSTFNLGRFNFTNSFVASRSNSIGVQAVDGSTVIRQGPVNFTGVGTQYDPLENQYGNMHSRIITA